MPAEGRQGITIDRVRQALARRGWAGLTPLQVPPDRLSSRPVSDRRPAAVLCALFEEDGEAHVILTRRSSNLRSHTGEVSFPGGRLDEGEPAVDAALRETREEVGIEPSAVEILGPLSPLVTVRGQVLISPFVGALPARPVLVPNPAEVERAFDVSLAELVSDGVFREELWDFPGAPGDPGVSGARGTPGVSGAPAERGRPISFFELWGDTVWGATAWMLRDLLELTLDPGR